MSSTASGGETSACQGHNPLKHTDGTIARYEPFVVVVKFRALIHTNHEDANVLMVENLSSQDGANRKLGSIFRESGDLIVVPS